MNFVFLKKKKKWFIKKKKRKIKGKIFYVSYFLRCVQLLAMNSTRQTLIINYYTLVEIAQAPVQWIERIENLLFPIIYSFFSLTNKKYFLRKKKKIFDEASNDF